MAFDPLYFSSAGGQSKRGAAPQQFGYKTADSRATITAPGYIPASYARMLSIGDIIDVVIVDSVTSTTSLIETAELRVTNITSAGVISVADETFSPYTGGVLRIPVFFNQTDLLAGTTQYMPAPVSGTVKRLVSTVQTAVTTGGVLGLQVAGTDVTGLSITVADGATVGTTQQDTPSSVQRVTAGQALGFTASAAFATAGAVHVVVEIVPDVDYGDIFIPFYCNATDLSAGTSQWWPVPVDGQIVSLHTAVQVAIVTGGAVTTELETVAVTGLSVTIADSATVGTVGSDTPTSTTTVSRGVDIETVFAAAFNGGGAVNGGYLFRPTNRADTRDRCFTWFSANQTDVLAPTSHYVPNCVRGYISRAMTAVQIAVGTGGNVTFEQANVAVLGLTVAVANSAPAGDIDVDNATAGDDTSLINDASAIEVVFDAAFATTGALNGFIETQALL
jgi:hypothetical protein